MRRSCFLFLVLIFLSSCSSANPNREHQWQTPFSATIEGTRGELAFCAEIKYTGAERSICYLLPQSMAGITVTETAEGVWIAHGDWKVSDSSGAAGLLEPLNLLTLSAELYAVQQENGEKILTYADGTKIILQKENIPRAVIGADIFFTVSNFQKLS